MLKNYNLTLIPKLTLNSLKIFAFHRKFSTKIHKARLQIVTSTFGPEKKGKCPGFPISSYDFYPTSKQITNAATVELLEIGIDKILNTVFVRLRFQNFYP